MTDRGTEFLGAVNEYLKRGRIIHRTTSAYRPQANGLVESMNKHLVRALRAAMDGHDLTTWEAGLTDFLTNYRGFRHSSTGRSPHELIMGQPMRLPWRFHALPRHVLPDSGDAEDLGRHMTCLLASLAALWDGSAGEFTETAGAEHA